MSDHDDPGSGDEFDDVPDDDFDDDAYDDEGAPLDDHETALIRQDLLDLESFEGTFDAEGYRGVSVFCQDCAEEHFYPWDMLRENLRTLLETGETPVHEPAFAPDPDDYVPWEYARGYVDALSDAGVQDRRHVDICPRCKLDLSDPLKTANFCPRCGSPLLLARLEVALTAAGMDEDAVETVLREVGLLGR